MLSEKLLVLIPQSVRIIRKYTTQSLKGSLTLQQIRVLVLIQEGQGVTQMSETLQVSLAAVSKMVNGLIKKNLVAKKSGEDRRVHVMKLTHKGTAALNKVKSHVVQQLNLGLSNLNKEEKEQLLQGLLVLEKFISKMKEV